MATQRDRDGPFWDCRRSCDHLVYFTAKECMENECDNKERSWANWWMGPASSASSCRTKCVNDARAAIPKCYEKCSEEFRGRKLKARYHNAQQANFQIQDVLKEEDNNNNNRNNNIDNDDSRPSQN